MRKITDSQIQRHFDSISSSYDYYKAKNSYYYESIINSLQTIIPKNKRILDFGCGTGDILASLKPLKGTGIDLSPKLIEIAKIKHKKNKKLIFKKGSKPIKGRYDFIILIDVVEHLSKRTKTFKQISNVSNRNTVLIISCVPSFWEGILDFLEKIKFKMPEGPHHRISKDKLEYELNNEGFVISLRKTIAPLPSFLFPIKLILEKLNIAPINLLICQKI